MTLPPPPSNPTPSGADPSDLVDRLADGTLDAEGRMRLNAAIERDPALQRDAQGLERVNDHLRSFFAAPTVDVPAMPSARSVFSRRAAFGLLAACVVIGGAVLALTLGGPSGWAREARDLYRSIEAAGFKPQQVCTTPEQFAQWTDQNLGEALMPQLAVPGLELVGWNKSSTFSPYTGVLIAKVEGKGVIVLLDQAALMQNEGMKSLGGGLRAFPGMIGSVGVVEVTPHDAPRVITTIKPTGS